MFSHTVLVSTLSCTFNLSYAGSKKMKYTAATWSEVISRILESLLARYAWAVKSKALPELISIACLACDFKRFRSESPMQAGS